MRELTKSEMKSIMDGAVNNIPSDIDSIDIIILVKTKTPKGVWINRISTCTREVANFLIRKWSNSQELFNKTGGNNSN